MEKTPENEEEKAKDAAGGFYGIETRDQRKQAYKNKQPDQTNNATDYPIVSDE